MCPVDPAAMPAWAERAAALSPAVAQSRQRSQQRAEQVVAAALRLLASKGSNFTTQELVKEAGIAIQTFYKYFKGKDQVILAVIEDLITDATAKLRERAADLHDPVARLHFYVTSALRGSLGPSASARFVTAEHWRLHQLYPVELEQARRPMLDLLSGTIQDAIEQGLLDPPDADFDAWLVSYLLTAVYHYYEFAPLTEPIDVIAERCWAFCLAALGGSVR